MVKRLGEIVGNPNVPHRSFFSAAKVLAMLSRTNLAVVDATIRAEQHEELVERVAELEARLAAGGERAR
jgi:hypothetical protein